MKKLRIATRGSALALRQTQIVADLLLETMGVESEPIIVKTAGDRHPETPIAKIGTVGVFTKAIEEEVLAGEADLAVHSQKDLRSEETEGLTIAANPERGPVNDLLIIRSDIVEHANSPTMLPNGASVGTGSPRRAHQLLFMRPDVTIAPIRGNVPTRIEKLRNGQYNAIILAAAGIERLGLDLSDLTVVDLLPLGFLPAPGQGAIAVQCRTDNVELRHALSHINHEPTSHVVTAEWGLMSAFDGGCEATLACLGTVNESGNIRLEAMAFVDHVRRNALAQGPETKPVIEECCKQLRG